MPNIGLTPSWPKHRWDVDRAREKFMDPGTTLPPDSLCEERISFCFLFLLRFPVICNQRQHS